MKNTVLNRVLLRFQVDYETGYSGLLISALFTQVTNHKAGGLAKEGFKGFDLVLVDEASQ